MKQHYIPQFILRNFADENNKVRFSSNDDKKSRIAKVENVFQEWNMYVDENLENDLEIENSLSQFESDIAPLIHRFIEAKEKFVWLDKDEYYSLMIFLRLLFFRSKDMKDAAMKNEIIKDVWVKSLLGLSKCRTLDDLKYNREIQEGFKASLVEEMEWYYIVLAERLGNDDYIISSAYPTGWEILSRNLKFMLMSIAMPVLYFYPISPKRIIILVHKMIPQEPEKNLPIRKDILKGAGLFNGKLKLPVWKMCGKDVRFINEQIKICGRHGYVSGL